MSLTVKAFLERDGKPDGEIRRFAIPADVSSSYDYLTKKISGIFPSLREGHFSLHWKDSEGDLVLFSTDEELLEALGFVTDSLFKVFIQNKDVVNGPNHGTGTAQPTEAHGKIHQGVICDGCNGLVRGIRYKCIECDDYDLCAPCEQKGVHSEHNMMKITKPSRAPFYSAPPHRGHGGQRQQGHGMGRFSGPGSHCGNGEFAPPPHFRRWMRRFMRRWHSENTPGCPMEQDSPDDELSPPEGPSFVYPGASPRSRQKGKGPLHKRKVSPVKCSSMASPRSEEAVIDLTAGNDQTVTMETEKTVEDLNVSAEEKSNETDEITKATENIALDDKEPVVEVENGKQPPEPTKLDVQHGERDRRTEGDDNDWLLLNVTTDRTPATSGPTLPTEPCQGPSHSAPRQEPVEEDADKAVAADATQAQTGSTITQTGPTSISSQTGTPRSVHFQIPPQIFYPPSNPRVAESLKQMMMMGFNNDGGWLQRLLEDKNGDIIMVLDAIKPQPGRSRETNGGYMA